MHKFYRHKLNNIYPMHMFVNKQSCTIILKKERSPKRLSKKFYWNCASPEINSNSLEIWSKLRRKSRWCWKKWRSGTATIGYHQHRRVTHGVRWSVGVAIKGCSSDQRWVAMTDGCRQRLEWLAFPKSEREREREGEIKR